jgi:serine protease Do
MDSSHLDRDPAAVGETPEPAPSLQQPIPQALGRDGTAAQAWPGPGPSAPAEWGTSEPFVDPAWGATPEWRAPSEWDTASPGRPAAAAPPPRGRSGRGGTMRVVVPAAVLSALLASGMTVALVNVTRPAAEPSAVTAASAAAVVFTGVSPQLSIEKIAATMEPSVVTIHSTGSLGNSPFGDQASGVGSGIVVSAEGLILTNDHVIADAASLVVVFSDGTHADATVVVTDSAHDLAVIRVNRTGLTPAKLGGSAAVSVGQTAIAIGSPLGTFTETVTQGIVSGLDREIDVADQASRSVRHLSGLIQTDAAINPGNSGGPLLDASGTVVGIITANATDAQGVGFAIPIAAAKDLLARASA